MINTKTLAKDGIFCALLLVPIYICYLTKIFPDSFSTIFFTIGIGVYFYNKNFSRTLISCFALIALSFIFFDLLTILIYVIPNVFLGLGVKYLLKTKPLIFYIATFIILFAFDIVQTLCYSTFVLDKPFNEYLIDRDMKIFGFEYGQYLPPALLVIIFFIFAAISSFLISIIIQESLKIYQNRIEKFVDK